MNQKKPDKATQALNGDEFCKARTHKETHQKRLEADRSDL